MGKRIALISANEETTPFAVYPVALARLAGAVEQAGHEAVQFDMLVDGEGAVLAWLAANPVDMVGVSLRNIDNTNSGNTRSYVDSCVRLVKAMRGVTSAPVVLGGSGYSLFQDEILRASGADHGIAGPAEESLCHLLSAENEKRYLTPFSGRHERRLIDYYWQQGGMIGVQTKRGCPRRCSYCTYPLIDGRGVQRAEAGHVADEVEKLYRDYGVDYFFVVDSIFNVTPDDGVDVAEEFIRRKLPVRWGAFFSPAGITADYLSTLRRAGLEHVELGTDSLCDEMLQRYRKEHSVEDAVTASRLCQEQDIHYAHYLIFGGPGETVATLKESLANSRQIGKTIFFPFAGVRVFPGIELYETALSEGAVPQGSSCLEPVFYFSQGTSIAQIWKMVLQQAGNRRRWLVPDRFEMVRPLMDRMRQMGRKGPLWEYLAAKA